MTKQELEALLKDFGTKGKQVAADIADKIETEKEEMDTETRRKVRAFWLPVGVVIGIIATVAVQYIM